MKVISEARGFYLVFDSVEDLRTVTTHLQGFLECVEGNASKPPPYLYAVFDDRINRDEMERATKSLKKLLGGG